MNLSEARLGSKVICKKIHGNDALRRRIMEMGITEGTEIKLKKTAPLGDPIELEVRGYELSIRKDDAKSIEI